MKRWITALLRRLGYVPASEVSALRDQLGAQRKSLRETESALLAMTATAERLERRVSRLTQEREQAEKQATRYQAMADELITMRANSLKYGLPMAEMFSADLIQETRPDLERDIYRVTISPRCQNLSFAVDRYILTDMMEVPELLARRIRNELFPAFERDLARAFAGVRYA